MEPENTNQAEEETNTLLKILVERFPMGCACFQPILNENGHTENYSVLCINETLEENCHLAPHSVTGKTVTEAFGAVSDLCVETLIGIAKEFETQDETAVNAMVSIYGHVYKVSSIVIFGTFILCFTEDIHSQYFRHHFRRSIPPEVLASIMAGSADDRPGRAASGNAGTAGGSADCGPNTGDGRKPVRRLPTAVPAEDLQDAPFRDSLTGLYTRCFAMELLRMYVDQQVVPLSVVLGDINGLQTINETLGFRAGDDILIRAADVLRTNCRMEDTIARWNDGEFIMLLPNTTQADTQRIIKRLREKLCSVCGEDYENIITFGYTTSGPQTKTADELLWEAEKWVFRKKLLITQSHRSSCIRLLLSVLRAKSAETEEHSDRMANHSRWIAKRMNLPDDMMDDMVLLSMLHDIGKVGIPDCILNKPGPLTKDERLIIEKHPVIGYRIAQTVPELRQVADFILAHHERWDGTGYPKALKGNDIPLVSRIIAVVDTYDVIVTGRKYRAPRTKTEAIDELRRCAGTQFDPDIVSVYVELLMGHTHLL